MLKLSGKVVGNLQGEYTRKDGVLMKTHSVQVLSNGEGRAKLYEIRLQGPSAYKVGQDVDFPVRLYVGVTATGRAYESWSLAV